MTKQPTKEIIIYLAGIMDADGYFTIKRSTYNIRRVGDSKNPHYFEKVGIKQAQPEAIKLIHQFWGGCFRVEKPSSKNGKPLYAIELTHKKAHKFVKDIYPFLRIKKRQAEILLELRKSLEKGKTKPVKSKHKDRWGNITEFTRYTVSDKEIKVREQLIKEIKSLNDVRSWSYIPK